MEVCYDDDLFLQVLAKREEGKRSEGEEGKGILGG
jgi:hypothetical protein